MAAAATAPVLSREELEQALDGQTEEQLKEMGQRLLRSLIGLAEALAEAEAETDDLKEESKYLNDTIDFMMKELSKLKIGSMNTVEPKLEEGPMAFVGRYWEQMKPRDTAYQTSEHVGEIRKPVATNGAAPTAQEVAQEIAHHTAVHAKQHAQRLVSSQSAQRLLGSIGPLLQKTHGFITEKQGEVTEAFAHAQENARQRAHARQQAHKVADASRKEAAGKRRKSKESTASAPNTARSDSNAAPENEVAVPEPAAAVAFAEAAAFVAEVSANEAPAAEEKMSSTLLIEAHITIDDGSVLRLEVKAADRCKEVASRFVKEHSLKAWFEAPLTTWLKKVENDAVKFPVKVEGNLTEIRKQFGKNR